ncbi:MAG: hypothetical protein HY747_06545 [Elusimicrobia bacterium]|nr:hypothetical protein [Elusimicrobiota bacterium]
MSPELSKVFEEYYNPKKIPYCLLRPNSTPKNARVAELHYQLYNGKPDHKKSFYDVLDYCLKYVEALASKNNKLLADLLYRLACGCRGVNPGELPDLKGFLPGFSDRWEDYWERFKHSRSADLEKLLKTVASEVAAGAVIKPFARTEPERTVLLPHIPSRRDAALLGGGAWPVFFKSPANRTPSSANVYLDVSGSMERYIPWMYGVICGLSRYISPRIYLFSNMVAEINREGLLKGNVKTTGGTDFDCVLEHIVKSRVSSALVITDGFAGIKRNDLAARVKKSCFVIGVLDEMRQNTPLSQFTRKVFAINFKEENP